MLGRASDRKHNPDKLPILHMGKSQDLLVTLKHFSMWMTPEPGVSWVKFDWPLHWEGICLFMLKDISKKTKPQRNQTDSKQLHQ